MKRAYKFILLLYPRGYRDQFAEEMTGVFEEASEESRAQGWAWHVRFAFAEIAGLIGGAAARGSPGRPRLRFLPRVRRSAGCRKN